jgi:hypothetical protein
MEDYTMSGGITGKINDFSIGAKNKFYEIYYNKKSPSANTQTVANNYLHPNSVWTTRTTSTAASYTQDTK